MTQAPNAARTAGDDGAAGTRDAQLARHMRHLQARLYASHLKPTLGKAVRRLPNTSPSPPIMCGRNAQHGRWWGAGVNRAKRSGGGSR